MTFTVKLSPSFERQAKGILSKFPAFRPELIEYLEGLEKEAPRGDQVQRHRMVWKDRIALRAYKIGKSGGLRIIMYFDGESTVCPLMIYHKADVSQPEDAEIRRAIKELSSLL